MAEGVKIAARNQKAFHEYFIDEKFEAGIELTGTEVKSIRLGTLSLKEAWCQIKDGQLFIRQMHIAPYEQGNIFNKDPLCPRRLLMHKREIMRLYGKVKTGRICADPAERPISAWQSRQGRGCARKRQETLRQARRRRKERRQAPRSTAQ